MALLSPKKLKKLKENPRAFFVDAFKKKAFPIKNALKRLKPKKKQGFAKYAIISAVYNVEKYLDNYFKSIINQRLDFKNNILIICVDDGSTDNSAKIIKKYQKKFPQNIVYLHKENGGQASARNLGLRFLEYLQDSGATSSLRGVEGAIHAENKGQKAKSGKSNLDCHDFAMQNLAMTAQNVISQNLAMTNEMETRRGVKITEQINNLDPKFKEISWVTFTDPDDFLDRDYFYEVDKFLIEHKVETIAMISCNIVNYIDKTKTIQEHILSKIRFKDTNYSPNINQLDFQMPSGNTSFFFLKNLLRINLLFPTDQFSRVNLEDVVFAYKYQLSNYTSKNAFLVNAVYYLRKTDNSTTARSITNKNYYLGSPILHIYLLKYTQKKLGKIPAYIQNIIIYHSYWHISQVLNHPQIIDMFSEKEIMIYLSRLDKCFKYINTESIVYFDIMPKKMDWFYKVGILNCFKNEYPLQQVVYIEEFDSIKKQILIRYFTGNVEDVESFRFDNKESYAEYEKTVQYDFLSRVFIYERRFWIKVPKDSINFEIFIRGQRSKIAFRNRQYLRLPVVKIYEEFTRLQNAKRDGNLWILMDKDISADDNAEHLYRYIVKITSERNIVFALRKSSRDYVRLLKEGFKLVDFESSKFKKLAKRANKIISSHADDYFLKYFKDKDFIFLQHGVICNNLSSWLNRKKINLFITSTKDEYYSIRGDFTRYKFGAKEVRLTGLARHDNLLKTNRPNSKQILIMPTWRNNLLKSIHKHTNLMVVTENFMKSEYFLKWQSLLKSKALKELCQRYNYQVIFNPHPNIKPHLSLFSLPDFIKVYKEGECSLQRLFGESALMITDYSSVAFEMAYLGKCVLYYQFDEQEFFAAHGQWQRGYFSYRKDGFGPVCVDEASLLNELENLLKNECKPSGIYKENIENTFEFKDGKCCERIFKAILELDAPYKRIYTLDYVLTLAQNALEHKCFKEAYERYSFILEHLDDESFKPYEVKLDESLILNYLISARKSLNSNEALEFIKEQGYENVLKFSNQLKFEIIKNYIALNDTQESIKRLELIELRNEDKLDFAYLKLKIYAYLGDKEAFSRVYHELKDVYKVDGRELEIDLFLFSR